MSSETASTLACIILIQFTSCGIFVDRVRRRKALQKSPSAIDFVFGVWMLIMNLLLSLLCTYVFNKYAYIAWVPKIDVRAFVALVAGNMGVAISVWINFLCAATDAPTTLFKSTSEAGIVERMWMHTIFGAVLSTTIMLLRV